MFRNGRGLENVLAANHGECTRRLGVPSDYRESAWVGCNDHSGPVVGVSHHIYYFDCSHYFR
jgi:hypothetical protein